MLRKTGYRPDSWRSVYGASMRPQRNAAENNKIIFGAFAMWFGFNEAAA